MMLLSQRNVWKQLEKHVDSIHFKSSLPSQTSKILKTDDISFDFSKQKIDDTALHLLIELAKECQIPLAIKQLVSGHPTNNHLPALHTALRAVGAQEPLWVNDVNVHEDIDAVRQQMAEISYKIRSGQWLGLSGKPITDVVNLGIGGSMLGPQFCIDALSDHAIKTIRFHFIAEYDDSAFNRTLSTLSPETTLFIVSSKSFTTPETLINAKKALQWLKHKNYFSQHFIAITAHPDRAQKMGFEHVLKIWDWVGGRYSVCSAINLITCIAIGFDSFLAFLAGAHEMDKHFIEADISQNLPIMLALLGIWNNNNLKIHNLLILTYAQSLQLFAPYLQQLEMESNGKSVDKQGADVNYATVPIVWGGSGNHAQHSYFQMVCQGTQRLTADLISLKSLDTQLVEQHKYSLTRETPTEDAFKTNNHHISLNHIELTNDSPKAIGALIALYEHKVFVQSVIWNINPFDQIGVEQMKQTMAQFVTHVSE